MHHNPYINYNILDDFRYQQLYLGARQNGKSVFSSRYAQLTQEQQAAELRAMLRSYWSESERNFIQPPKEPEYKPVNLDDYL